MKAGNKQPVMIGFFSHELACLFGGDNRLFVNRGDPHKHDRLQRLVCHELIVNADNFFDIQGFTPRHHNLTMD